MSFDEAKDDDFGLIAERGDPAVDKSSRDYAQVGPVRGVGAIKAINNPANRGRLLFIGFSALFLVGGLAYAILSVDVDDANRAAVGTVQGGTRVSASGNNTPSELQRKAAEEYNSKVLPEEQKTNPSAHPLVVVDENPYQPKAEMTAPSKVSETGKSVQTQRQAGQAQAGSGQAQRAAAQQDQKALDTLISGLIKSEGEKQPSLYSVSWSYPSTQGSTSAVDGTVAGEQLGVASAAACNPVVRAGQQFMGTADMALNSDVGGPVAMTIRNGKLRGQQLIGAFERKEEWVRIIFDKLVTPRETISTSAIGLDVDTTLNAVQGDVDRHLLYRYGWWGFGTVLKAIGTAAENNADQQVIISDGTPIQSTKADTSREIKMALGSLGTDIGAAMQERLNRPITVSLNVGDEIGVFFLDDVCSKTDERG